MLSRSSNVTEHDVSHTSTQRAALRLGKKPLVDGRDGVLEVRCKGRGQDKSREPGRKLGRCSARGTRPTFARVLDCSLIGIRVHRRDGDRLGNHVEAWRRVWSGSRSIYVLRGVREYCQSACAWDGYIVALPLRRLPYRRDDVGLAISRPHVRHVLHDQAVGQDPGGGKTGKCAGCGGLHRTSLAVAFHSGGGFRYAGLARCTAP